MGLNSPGRAWPSVCLSLCILVYLSVFFVSSCHYRDSFFPVHSVYSWLSFQSVRLHVRFNVCKGVLRGWFSGFNPPKKESVADCIMQKTIKIRSKSMKTPKFKIAEMFSDYVPVRVCQPVLLYVCLPVCLWVHFWANAVPVCRLLIRSGGDDERRRLGGEDGRFVQPVTSHGAA